MSLSALSNPQEKKEQKHIKLRYVYEIEALLKKQTLPIINDAHRVVWFSYK